LPQELFAMKISLITVCYNTEKTIERAIQSVLSQDYADVEYIIMDGLSKDSTMDIINKYKNEIGVIVSKKDNGMYDALNKGIELASGDIIGILNADDIFANKDILSKVAAAFVDQTTDAIIGDIAFVNDSGKIGRYYSAKKWNPNKFVWGFMPPHPSFYCRKEFFTKLGGYRTDFDIAADYELLIRFLKKHHLKYKYLPLLMVLMNKGGKSTNGLKSNVIINQEIKYACTLNNLKTNYLMLYSKYFSKIFEYARK
jgi:glycosyltransferase involved in cell wall biosynthesis